MVSDGNYCTFDGTSVAGDLAHTVDSRVTCNPANILKAGAYTGTITSIIAYTKA